MKKLIFALSFAAASAATFTATQHSVSLAYSPYGKPLVRYENGFFVAYDPADPSVSSFDGSGRPVVQLKLTLPDVYRFQPVDAAVAGDGTIAVPGSAYDSEGRLVEVIVWVGRDGKIARIVRTSPYAVFKVEFAGDGSLWTVGRVNDESHKEVSGHDTVRQYDKAGKLTRSLVSLDTFQPRPHNWHPARGSLLVAGEDRIGFLSPVAREYIEISLSGGVLGRWRMPAFTDNQHLLNAMIGRDGSLYINVMPESGTNALFTLDKATGSFRPVTIDSASWTSLAGGDGNQLLIDLGSGRYAWFSASK